MKKFSRKINKINIFQKRLMLGPFELFFTNKITFILKQATSTVMGQIFKGLNGFSKLHKNIQSRVKEFPKFF